ncbi:MAG TPA: hypothetical protein VGD71_24205 [Kribbella sp.]|jgi:hypothetical protein
MRLLSLLAAAGLVAGGAVAAAPAATAAGTCSLYVPSRFSIGQEYRDITVPQGPNCAAAGVVGAFWFAHHPTKGDVTDAGYENKARSTTVTLYDTMPIGRWTWRPGTAWDTTGTVVYQYTTYTDVRLATYGRVTPTRSGTKVNVKTTAMRYWQGGHKFIGWSGARGQIQYRTPGTTTWRALKDVYSTSTGAYSYTYTTSAVRDYRVVFGDVSTMWGSTSPIVRK